MPQFDYTGENSQAQTSTDAQAPVTLDLLREASGSRDIFRSDGGGPLSATVRNTDGANSIDAELRGSNFSPTELAILSWPVIVAAVTIGPLAAANLEDNQAGLKNYAVLIAATVGGSQGTALVRFAQKAVG